MRWLGMKTIRKEDAIKDFWNRVDSSNLKWLRDGILFLTVHGSWAYGTNIETSDVDIKGFAVPPREYYLGVSKAFEQAEFRDPDSVVYELRKFFKLASDSNPNILEILYTDESDWIFCGPVARNIVRNKHLFLSKRAFYTFFGYARAQLKRINSHYRWLKNPPSCPPTRTEFGLSEKPIIAKEQLSMVITDIQKKIEEWDIDWSQLAPSEKINMQSRITTMFAELNMISEDRWTGAAKLLGYEDNFIHYVQKEREYKGKCADWSSFQNWKETRNPQRAVIEAKFGYDTKNAMHLVRLIRMCREILESGRVVVKRPDSGELISIREGAMKYDELVEWADKQEMELAGLYKTCSILPRSPDMSKIDALAEESICSALSIQKI